MTSKIKQKGQLAMSPELPPVPLSFLKERVFEGAENENKVDQPLDSVPSLPPFV